MLIEGEAKQIYEAWMQARADYEKETDPLIKAIYAEEGALLLQLFIQATDN
jgi:hypothetical protein